MDWQEDGSGSGIDPDALWRFASMYLGGTSGMSASDRLKQEGEAFSSQVQNAQRRGPPVVYSALLQSPWIIRAGYIECYNHYTSTQKTSQSMHTIRNSIRPLIEHGIAPPMEAACPTTLREVATRVNHIHTEKVLYVKTIYKAYTVIGTSVLVEDECKDCMMLSLYNFLGEEEEEDDVLSVGTCLALLAPYMKNAKDDKAHGLMLRCDNPQCVVFFDTEAEWFASRAGKPAPPEAIESITLKEKGNEAFRRGKLNLAGRYYSRALRSMSFEDDVKVACFGNRADVSVRRGQWEDSERDSRAVLAIDGEHVKAKFRLAKALLHIGSPSEALQIMKDLLVSNAKERSFQALLSDCNRAVEEQKGKYSFDAIRSEKPISKEIPFHSNFVSKSIEVGVDIELPGGGTYRGCKAVRDIEENELLCASKAFAFVPSDETDFTVQVNPYSNQLESQSQVELVSKVVAVLQRRPSLGKALYALSAGPDAKSILPCNLKKFDIPRIRRILNSNSFGASTSEDEILSDWERLKEEYKTGRPLVASEAEILGAKLKRGSGIWLKESMFNHSCTPNCNWEPLGEIMFVRSRRAIRAGEELTFTYLPLNPRSRNEQTLFVDGSAPAKGSIVNVNGAT